MTISQISSVIFGLIGGLGLFLFGMKLMSEGLQKAASNSLKKILEKLTSNRIIGTMVGAVVTMVIQSSSATTVMVVGFVNAGLMSLTQALSVILGANVGTTITGQIIAFKITLLSLPCIGIGVLMLIFLKKPVLKYAGEIIFGFGLLFFGMDIMTKAFVPLSQSQSFENVFIYFSKVPLLAVMAGAITTLIVQSSSATIGITMALATTGVLDFQAAAALVLGENIGTTITANLAALNASRTAKQAALGHFLLNTIGVAYMLILLHPFMHLVNAVTPGNVNFIAADGTHPYIARHIANLHTMFNLINTVVFLPFIPLLARLCEKIIKPDPQSKEIPQLVHLSDALISTPEIAVELAKKETGRMFETALDIYDYAGAALLKKSEEDAVFGRNLEKHLELFDREICGFLEKLAAKPLSERSETMLKNLTHTVGEIKQLGERSEKIIKTSQKLADKKIVFSPEAEKELSDLFAAVRDFARKVYGYYESDNAADDDFEGEEDAIDRLRKSFKKNHIKRLNEGSCSLDGGLTFVDLLSTLEKIGDNIFSITQLIIDKKAKPPAAL